MVARAIPAFPGGLFPKARWQPVGLGKIAAAGVAWSAILIMSCMMMTMRWEMQQLRAEATLHEKQIRENSARMQQERTEHEERIKALLSSREEPSSEGTAPGYARVEPLAEVQTETKRSAASSKEALDEFLPRRPHKHHEDKDDDRRLGTVYTNIVAHTAMAKGVGCVSVDTSAAAVSIALNGQNCNGMACPNCFIFTAVGNTLTLSQCSAAYVGTTKKLGDSGFTAAVAEIVLINAATSLASISDGTNTHVLGPESAISAYCYVSGSNKFYFGNSYFNNGLHTGTGSSGTGATMSGAGALTLDDDLTVSGTSALAIVTTSGAVTMSDAATFHGTTTLGNEKTDTITIMADVITSGSTNPKFDFSASTGTFSTSLGTKSIGGTGTLTITGGLTVGGDTSLNGDVNLGNANTDSVLFHGLVAASGTNAAFNIGTSAFTAGDSTLASVVVSGTTTLQGVTTLGDESGDTVWFYGHVASASGSLNFDLSNSTGTFATPQDVIQCSTTATTVAGGVAFGSTISVTGAATLSGATTFGTASTDTVTIKGNVAVPTTDIPAMNFGGAAITGGDLTITGTADITGAATFANTVELGDATGTDTITLKGPISSGAYAHDFTSATAINGPQNTNANSLDICVYDAAATPPACTRSA